MKKVLFATTALIATASMAAAEVRISGYGRFGLGYSSGSDAIGATGGYPYNDTVAGESSTFIVSRLRLQFDMSTETDSGVALGARVRAEADGDFGDRTGVGGSQGPTAGQNNPQVPLWSAPRFYATFGGFTLGVGNIIGALEGTPGLYLETRSAGAGLDGMQFVAAVTNVNNEYFNWDYFDSDGNGFNGVEAMYSAGAFAAHISYTSQNGNAANPTLPTPAPVSSGAIYAPNRERAAVNLSYQFGDWRAAIGFQDSNYRFEDKTLVTLSGNLGQFGVRVAYADNDGVDKFGLYGNMDIGAASNVVVWVTDEGAVSAADVAAGRNDNRDSVAGSNQQEGTSYGINYSYDLGGGASFEAGAQKSSYGNTQVQAGAVFSF